MRKVCSRCLKNHFQLDFKQYGFKSSQTSTSQLQILEKFKSLAYVLNFRYRFIARHPPPPHTHILLQKHFSIDNSVRRLLMLKIVLHSLFAGAIDGLRPNSAYVDSFWLICGGSFCIKKTFFHSGRDNFKSEMNIWAYIGPTYQGFCVATREYLKKNRTIVRHTDFISENKRLKCQFMIPLKTIFA